MTQQPKWKIGNAVAVWDFGDRISIKLFDWNYISVPKNPDYKEEVVNNVRAESVPNGA